MITTDGKVYSYILKYGEHIGNPNRFISIQESIGDAKKALKTKTETNEGLNTSFSVNDSPDFLKSSCESLLKLPEEKNIRKKKGDVVLSLKNLKHH